MSSIIKYINLDLLCYYGFNYDGPSSVGHTEKGRFYRVHTGYFGEKNMVLVIASSKDERGKTEWFFNMIQDMNEKEMTGSRNTEFESILENIIRRKNRIAGRNLLRRIEEVTGEPAPF